MTDDIINPYIAGNPVTGQEMFFGRDDIFDFIRRTLTGQHRDQVIVLYGQRRTGKTSILYQMHRRLDPRYLCIFIDLHGLLMDSEASFLWELAGQIRRVLGRDHGITLPPPDRVAFEADARSYFANDFLDQAWGAVGDRHILLMIDEAVRLQEQVAAGKLDKSIFEYLRHLMQHYDQLNFLFSIGSGLEQMEKEYAFLFNVALYKKISFLERAAAVDLITKPAQAHYRVEPAAVDRILEVTACHPYYTQLVCHSLFNRLRQRGGDVVEPADVDAVLEEVVERGLAVLKHIWEESTPGEKATIAGLATAMGERNRPVGRSEAARAWERLGVTLPAGEAARAMKSLAARDILSGDEQVRFTVDLQHFWARKFQRLEWVREEIREQVEVWNRQPAAPPTPARTIQAETVDLPAVEPQPVAATPAAAPAPRAGFDRTALVFIVAALLLGAAVLLAAVLELGPFGSDADATLITETGGVVPGVDDSSVVINSETGLAVIESEGIMLVNDLEKAVGVVWAATDGGLVRWTTDNEGTFTSGDAIGLPDDGMQTIAAASDGTLWIGGGGVSHVRPEPDGVRFLDYYDRDSDLGMGVVRELMIDVDQSIWAGGNTSYESPISRFDGEVWDYNALPLESLESQGLDLRVWSLLRDFDGDLWIGLISDGILRWDGENWTHWGPEEGVGGTDDDVDTRVRGLVQDDQGNIWAAAGYRGLLIYVPDTDSWEFVPVADITDWVTAVSFIEDGALWVGQEDGTVLRSYDYGETWDVMARPEDGLGVDITDIISDADLRMFVSSYGGGVSVYDNGAWTRLQQ